MVPCHAADAWWTSKPAHFYVWTTPTDFQTMAAYHASWRDFPHTFLNEVPVHRPSYRSSDYAGMSVERVYDPVMKRPTPRESRKFFLHRSVYDLVAAYPYLTLTDSRLLGWYLCLSPEDRRLIQDEGGLHQFLQRHPALEVSRHHIYVKYSTSTAQPVMTTNQQVSRTAGAEGSCETPSSHLDLEMLPSTVRENLTLLGSSSNRNGQQVKLCGQQAHVPDGFRTACSSPITEKTHHQKAHCGPGLPLSQLNEERYSWQTGSSAAVCKHPAGLMSFSLDVELERCRQRRKPEPRSHISMPQGQSADFSTSQSEWPMATKESPSKYHSIDSIQMDGPEYTDRSIIQVVELAQVTAEENATKDMCQDKDVHGTEYTADDDDALLSFEDQSDTFHSLMEDDKSILICLASDSLKSENSGVHSCSVTTNSDDTPVASSETSKFDQSATEVKTAEKRTSPMSCDVMIGTEVALCPSSFAQTEDLETADKHINTEVRMADLDYLTKEFIKLKETQDVKERKEKMKSAGCKMREYECMERAEQAELALLALQYSICRQHCWRLYYTSAEGNQLTSMAKDPPPNIVNVLQKLESDYEEMKSKIQAGVPLQQQKPLSVDSGEIITGASFIPARIICDLLGEVSSGSSQEPQKPNTPGGDSGCSDNQSQRGLQVDQQEEKLAKKENSKTRRAATLIPQDRASAGQEVSTGETWYDAEEHLEFPGDVVAAAVGQDPTLVTRDTSDESASEEATSSVLCVSNLPSTVTKRDVMLLFEKYHSSEVSISALKDLRFAVVMLSGTQSAETAVKELNGCRMQGHTLHLEHISGAMSSSQASACEPDSSQDAAQPQTSKTDSGSTEMKPVRPSIRNRKVVCISPTAKGTFVPQHYGTMGSFDTLMAELTQLHPEVGRQRIVDALLELRAKHQGVLCGLPLRTIREMTSDLLTRPQTAKQL